MPLPTPPRPSASKLSTTLRFFRDPIGLFEDAREECGDIFSLPIPGMGEWVCICSPELLREIDRLPGTIANPEPIKTRVTGGLVGNRSILFLNGEEHKERQKIVIRHFTTARLARFVPFIRDTARRLLDERVGAGSESMLSLFHRLALEVATKVTLGETFDRRETRDLIEAFEDLADRGLRHPLTNMPPLQKDWGPWSPWGKIVRLARRTRRQYLDAIELAVREDRVDPNSVLASLLDADVDRDAIVDEVFTLLLGGHETTGAFLTWTVQKLSAHPEKLRKLRAELDAVVPDGGIERDDIRRLPYLEAVVKESLRSSPIGPAGGGRTIEDDCQIGGYHVAKGTTVVFGLHAMAHRPEDWEDGAEFRPERFLRNGQANTSAWVPFGTGRRTCTGKSLALLEMQVVIGTLMQAYEVTCEAEEPRPTRQGLVFAPAEGLRARVEERQLGAKPSWVPSETQVAARGTSDEQQQRPGRPLSPRPALVAESGVMRCPFHFG